MVKVFIADRQRFAMHGVFVISLVFVLIFAWVQLSPFNVLSGENLIVKSEFWKPAAGEKNQFPDIPRDSFMPFSGMLSVGNLQEEVWLRLLVRAQSRPSFLTIGPGFVDKVTVYQRLADGQWKKGDGGISVQNAASDRPLLSVSFPIVHQELDSAANTHEMFVQVRSASAFITAQVRPQSELAAFDQQLRFAFGFYAGISFLLLALCLVIWLTTGEALWLDVAAYDGAFVFYAAAQSGMLFNYFPIFRGAWAFDVYVLSVVSVVACMCRFQIKALELFNAQRWLKVVYYRAYWFAAISMVLILIGLGKYALLINNVLIAFFCFWGMLVMVSLRSELTILLITFRLLLAIYVVVPLCFVGAAILKLPLSDQFIHLTVGQNNIITMVMILLLFGLKSWEKSRLQLQVQSERDVLAGRLAAEKDKLEEMSGFLSMIMHELKNPLNFIRLAISNLNRTFKDNPQQLRLLEKIQRNISSIDSVLERSQSMDALMEGRLVISKSAIELSNLMSEVVKQFDEAHLVKLQGPTNMVIDCDKEVLSLILRNLIVNALKYSPKGSFVDCKYDVYNQYLHVQVLNDVGRAGHPDATKLFKKFYRAQEAMHISGSGLGLYWVNETVKILKGTLQYSMVNKKICFELWLPI